ncbi:polysaccharide lyase [Echinicola jeungdonensis]|uniref:Polysaccharide lyase n=1 Tax=Echinicola jeungdonensis TaxID=709343 RepID=A0ABV5J0F2_9BACT|nr:polysaccharide lyase [Echinicola jeungdonensis]MDN3671164.1 polysaccharide lyase [Echinicola jeungdonensis]
MNFLNTNLRYIMAASLIGVGMSACDVSGLEESNLESEEIYKATSSANLIYFETFEDSDPLSFAHHQYSEDYSFGRSQDPVFEGAYSGRFELRDDDEMASSGTRSEVLFPDQDHNERWYSFSLYLPSDGFKKDSNNDIINQWHQGSGSGSPTTTLRVEDDRFFLKSGPTKEERKDYDIAAVQKDTWNEFVIHIIHSGDSDGLVELWMNGEKMLNINGGNLNKDYDLPRWKIGIYKDDWNYDETTDTDLRVMYFDNVRMGDENASFEEMSTLGGVSSSSDLEEEPVLENDVDDSTTSTEGVGLTLINTSSDEPIGQFGTGALITAKNHRLSIVPEFGADQPSSVRFELSGTDNRTLVDDEFPFALNGDDGNGNFWYGDGLYPGDYKLVITPYDDEVAREPLTYTFTIEEGEDNIITEEGVYVTGETTSPVIEEEESTSPVIEEEESTLSPYETEFPINYLTLINTSYDEPVDNFNSGALIIAKDHRLSIVPEFGTNRPTSVQFELSGADNRIAVDDEFPFALNGDDGNGDFWYGDGLYPGNYELVITPYNNGVAQESITYTFTIEAGEENYITEEGGYVAGETTSSVEEEESTTSESLGSPINYLTLMNTSPDGTIGNFYSGDHIVAEDHRLSIVPNFGSEQPAEVKFELSGEDNRSSIDDEYPFALNGDDGNGDFWYGDGLYPGDYELIVTPYYEVNGEKVPGTSTTFTFTISEGSENYIK